MTSEKQAIAIGLSEARSEGKNDHAGIERAAETAYLIALKRGFVLGFESAGWAAA